MRKFIVILFFIVGYNIVNSQTINIHFNDDISVDSMNRCMTLHNLPLFFVENGSFDTMFIKIFYNGNYIFSTYSNLSGVYANKNSCLLLLYDYAGYDRIVFINRKKSIIYFSNKFNYCQSGSYKYSLQGKKIKIIYFETKKTELLPLHLYNVQENTFL